MPPAQPHVIVIDADPKYSSTVGAAFQSLGCRVSSRDEAEAGLALVLAEQPDLVVVSAEIPKLTGFVVCNKIKRDANLKTLPVIMVTGSTAQEAIDDHSQARTCAQAYLPRSTDARVLATQGKALIAAQPPRVAAPPPPPPPPPKPAASATAPAKVGFGLSSSVPMYSAEELQIVDDELERLREEQEWTKMITSLEARLLRVADRAQKINTLEQIMQIHAVETINGPESIRAAERLMLLVPDHAGAVSHLRKSFTRRKDNDRLAELDAHLERIRQGGGSESGRASAPPTPPAATPPKTPESKPSASVGAAGTRWEVLLLNAARKGTAWSMTGAKGEAITSWAAIAKHLNDLGSQGWELVSSAEEPRPEGLRELTFSLKRPLR